MIIRSFSAFLLFFSLFACNSKGQKNAPKNQGSFGNHKNKDTGIVIYSYGYVSRGTHTDQLIAKKYGFQYISGGCTISADEAEKAKINNNHAKLLLEKRNGKNWEERFEEDLQQAKETENKVKVLVFKEQFIINLNKKIREKNSALYLQVDPTDSSDIFTVKVSAWDESKKGSVLYYILQANLKTQQVKIISDKQELLISK